jgi:hypothetical protein
MKKYLVIVAAITLAATIPLKAAEKSQDEVLQEAT